MIGKILPVLVLMLLIGTVIPISVLSSSVKTITVDDDGGADYKSIQDAIDASDPGDTIYVYSGRYNERLDIGKNLILTGENKETTMINYSGYENVINFSADNIKMNGFTIIKDGGYDFDAIIEIQANNSVITNNTLKVETQYSYYSNGVYILSDKKENVVSNNTFIYSGLELESEDIGVNEIKDNIVNGKPLVYLDGTKNEVIDHAGQIILSNCENISIKDAEIDHTSIAIKIIDSDDCIIQGCNVQRNTEGIMIVDSKNTEIMGNTITSNSYGLKIFETEKCSICNNDITSNSQAIWFEYVNKANVTKNNLYSNGICLNIYFSNLNKIKQNNFANNVYNVMAVMCSLNTYHNNYWNRPRIFPKIIFEFPRINFDWYPANEPFDNM